MPARSSEPCSPRPPRSKRGPDGVVRNIFPLEIPLVTAALSTYRPTIGTFTAHVRDTHVEARASGTCDMGLGITMRFSEVSRIVATLQPATGALRCSLAGRPTFDHDVDISLYDRALALGGGLSGEVILQAVASKVGNALGDGIQGASDANISKAAPHVVQWTGASGFVPVQGASPVHSCSVATSANVRHVRGGSFSWRRILPMSEAWSGRSLPIARASAPAPAQ